MDGQATEKSLSIIIPCYNERHTIETLVRKVMDIPIRNKEVIIVDDYSSDGTHEILEEKIRPLGVKIIYHVHNGGKGAALRTGFQNAIGDVVIVQDADLEYDPQEIPKVVNPIFNMKADVVFGSRFSRGVKYDAAYKKNIIANRFLTALSNLFTGLKITDMETCYKAFRRDIIQSIDLKEKRFGFEPEITAKVAKLKCRVLEVPISYYPRKVEEGKKINWKDGVKAVYCIWRYRGRK